MRKLLLLALLSVALFRASKSCGQGAADPTEHDRHIKKGYKSYSLFLVCSGRWLGKDKESDLSDLYRTFLGFGESIGDDNLAVWFFKKKGFDPAASVDVPRSVSYCQRWDLKPSESPYLVVTTTYPDSTGSGLPEGSAVFALGTMSKEDIQKLLEKLTDDLVKYDAVHNTKPSTTSPVSPDIPKSPIASPDSGKGLKPQQQTMLIRLLSVVQQSFGSFGCGWSFELSTGPVKTKYEPCKS